VVVATVGTGWVAWVVFTFPFSILEAGRAGKLWKRGYVNGGDGDGKDRTTRIRELYAEQ
jgi:hypothetical protein